MHYPSGLRSLRDVNLRSCVQITLPPFSVYFFRPAVGIWVDSGPNGCGRAEPETDSIQCVCLYKWFYGSKSWNTSFH